MVKATPHGGANSLRTLKMSHSSAVEDGDVVVSNGQVLIACSKLAANREGAYVFRGPVEFPKGAEVFVVGDTLYWDNTAAKVTAIAEGNTRIGLCIAAATAEDGVALADLEPMVDVPGLGGVGGGSSHLVPLDTTVTVVDDISVPNEFFNIVIEVGEHDFDPTADSYDVDIEIVIPNNPTSLDQLWMTKLDDYQAVDDNNHYNGASWQGYLKGIKFTQGGDQATISPYENQMWQLFSALGKTTAIKIHVQNVRLSLEGMKKTMRGWAQIEMSNGNDGNWFADDHRFMGAMGWGADAVTSLHKFGLYLYMNQGVGTPLPENTMVKAQVIHKVGHFGSWTKPA